MSVQTEIFSRFIHGEKILKTEEFGSGHINDTYLVSTVSDKYILQKVNSSVFIKENLIHNYSQLLNSVNATGQSSKFFPGFYFSENGKFHEEDDKGNIWRVITYIGGSVTNSISGCTDITFQAAKAMSDFQSWLNTLPVSDFKPTIEGFHNPLKRIKQFEEILGKCHLEKKNQAAREIEFAQNNLDIARDVSKLLAGELPIRITHNDTKLENILFRENKDPLVIDLDTVMPGSVIFDFGDMVRSATSLAAEDEKDLNKVGFHIDHFTALCEGYLNTLSEELLEIEKRSIYQGILCVILIQGIRFLWDFLDNNNYYKTEYSDHNLVRCRTQFKLLEEIIKRETEVRNIIEKNL